MKVLVLGKAIAALAVSVLAGIGVAGAQQYPSRSITIITAAAAGAPVDLLARHFAERLRQKLGVPTVVENVTGGQGIIATQRVLQARADGYTFLLSGGALTTTPLIMPTAGYTVADFAPIAPIGQVPYVLLGSKSFAADGVPAVVAYLKANAKNLNSGVLTSSYLSTLLSRKLAALAGVELTEIGYRGSSDMIKSLLTDDIQMMATTYSVAAPHLETGKVKALGALADDRLRQLPNLPTFRENGHPSIKLVIWTALFAKAGTPPEIVETVRRVAYEAADDPAYNKAMENTGMEPWLLSFDKLQRFLDEDAREFASDAKTYKLKTD